MASPEIRVTKLNYFPIKSCHGLQVKEVTVDSYGVEGDRRFMLVDGKNRFVTQRKFSKLATVHPTFVLNERGEKMLRVHAPGMETELLFPPISVGERIEADIWNDQVMVIDQGEKPAEWFSKFIGHGGTYIRLVGTAESISTTGGATSGQLNFNRLVKNLPLGFKEKLPAMQLALADSAPISMVSCESLADLNIRMRERGCEAIPLKRFRMNIEISGCSKPFEEDDWLLIQIGEVPFVIYRDSRVSGYNIFQIISTIYIIPVLVCSISIMVYGGQPKKQTIPK